MDKFSRVTIHDWELAEAAMHANRAGLAALSEDEKRACNSVLAVSVIGAPNDGVSSDDLQTCVRVGTTASKALSASILR